MKTCANCDPQIGKLETPGRWSGHVVCAGCYATLSAAARPASEDALLYMLADQKLAAEERERARQNVTATQVVGC